MDIDDINDKIINNDNKRNKTLDKPKKINNKRYNPEEKYFKSKV